MITRIFAIAAAEFRIQRRNRWLVIATGMMMLFALALTFAGSAPTGVLGVDLLTVSVASMTTLAVYLAPFLALMVAFDAVAGESERGTLGLVLTYPFVAGGNAAGQVSGASRGAGHRHCLGAWLCRAGLGAGGWGRARERSGPVAPHRHGHSAGRGFSGAGLCHVLPFG